MEIVVEVVVLGSNGYLFGKIKDQTDTWLQLHCTTFSSDHNERTAPFALASLAGTFDDPLNDGWFT